MRRLALLVLLALVCPAHALVILEDPPVVAACGRGKTWADVNACLARQGAVYTEGTLPKAKLVRLVQTEDKRRIDQGIYLYLQRPDGSWSVGGMFAGGSYTVLAFAPLTLENHPGYRISVGQIMPASAHFGDPGIRVMLQVQRTLFCSGLTYSCSEVVTHCDALYRGKAMWTFRGSLDFAREPNVVHNAGDRSRGGPICAPPERVVLGWPSPPRSRP